MLVSILSARGLPAADKGGTSDAYCKIELWDRGRRLKKEEARTPTAPKTLTPSWHYSSSLGETDAGRLSIVHLLERAGAAADSAHDTADADADDDGVADSTEGGPKLELIVFDEDKGMFDKDDKLGGVTIDLRPLAVAAMAKHKDGSDSGAGAEQWYPLARESAPAGEVLVGGEFDSAIVEKAMATLAAAAAQAEAERAAAAAEEAANTEDDEHAQATLGKEPNELHITLIAARGLLVMDTKLFGKGGSSGK